VLLSLREIQPLHVEHFGAAKPLGVAVVSAHLRFLVSRWYATTHRLGGAGWRGSQDEEIILIREADVIAGLS
jgi:hypothetical protein